MQLKMDILTDHQSQTELKTQEDAFSQTLAKTCQDTEAQTMQVETEKRDSKVDSFLSNVLTPILSRRQSP